MCLGLITLFRRFSNRSGRLGEFLSRHAFSVYVVHAPVIVLLAIAVREINPSN
jgi:surface polysaccharide O-acyltransferase-like enzyme